MAYLKRRGSRWFACFYVAGVKKVIATGIPVSTPDASVARLRKLALSAAESMERVAKGKTVLSRAMENLRTLAREEGLSSTDSTTLTGYFTSHIRPQYKPVLASILDYFRRSRVTQLEEVTPSLLTDYFSGFVGRLATGTIKRYKVILSSVFRSAVNDSLIARNPCTLAKLPAVTSPPQERKAFTLEEINLLITAMPEPWSILIRVAYLAGGLRLGDVCLLTWSAIDLATGTITLLPRKTRSTGKKLLIAISPPLRSLLTTLPHTSEYVFPEFAARFLRNKSHLSQAFIEWLHRLGLASRVSSGTRHFNQLSFHSIRHTVVTQLRSAGLFAPDVIRSVVGHASENVERGYFHAPRDKQLEVYSFLASSIR